MKGPVLVISFPCKYVAIKFADDKCPPDFFFSRTHNPFYTLLVFNKIMISLPKKNPKISFNAFHLDDLSRAKYYEVCVGDTLRCLLYIPPSPSPSLPKEQKTSMQVQVRRYPEPDNEGSPIR